jgi:GNAT superfamily N-acetyltransferase
MKRFLSCLFYSCVINFSIANFLSGMENPELSPEQLEEMISILHERKNPFPDGSHKKDIIHLIPAASEDEFTRITHFAPHTQQESDEAINDICSRYKKIWWFITHTKKFDLEKRLQDHQLAPHPIPAMILALSQREQPSLNSEFTIQTHPNPMNPSIVEYKLAQNQESISKGSLFFHKDWIGIVNVATEEKYRKKGFGTILMNYLLHTAHERGARWAILESTKEAYNLYKKLGFKEVMKTNIYNRG